VVPEPETNYITPILTPKAFDSLKVEKGTIEYVVPAIIQISNDSLDSPPPRFSFLKKSPKIRKAPSNASIQAGETDVRRIQAMSLSIPNLK